MRRARQVLTSSDPNYRAKVEVIIQTLQTLGDTETLFFIDELGPLSVKKHGGRSFVKKGEALVVPQLQTPKGSIVLAGAAGVIVFGSDASSLATEKDIRSVVDLCRELGILVIEEPQLPALAIVATHADRF